MMKPLLMTALILSFTFLQPVSEETLIAAEFHVAPTGTPVGDGSRDNPWDLASALAHPTAVQPDDTIWLHGGKYKGSFLSHLKGRKNSRIVVRHSDHDHFD